MSENKNLENLENLQTQEIKETAQNDKDYILEVYNLKKPMRSPALSVRRRLRQQESASISNL